MILYLIPLISACIGWLANHLLIKMLFRPLQPVNVLGITIQGVFPKRQPQFAQQLGAFVAKQLINLDEIASKLNDPQRLKSLTPVIEEHIDNFLKVKLQEKLPMISMFIGDNTLGKVKDGLMEEIDALLPQIINKYTGSLAEQINIEQVVTNKIAALSPAKLQNTLETIMQKEFRFVKMIGAALGFVIGLIQLILTTL